MGWTLVSDRWAPSGVVKSSNQISQGSIPELGEPISTEALQNRILRLRTQLADAEAQLLDGPVLGTGTKAVSADNSVGAAMQVLRDRVGSLQEALESKQRAVQFLRLCANHARVTELQLEQKANVNRCVASLRQLAAIAPYEPHPSAPHESRASGHDDTGWNELRRQVTSLGAPLALLEDNFETTLRRSHALQRDIAQAETEAATGDRQELEDLERQVAQAKEELKARKESRAGIGRADGAATDARLAELQEEATMLREEKSRLEGSLDALRRLASRE